MNTTTHPLAEEYLRRLDHSARVLPRADREDLVAQIRSHVHSGLGPEATEADVRNLLDELGPPDDIVATAGPGQPQTRRGAREVFALILLVTGLPPVLGWLAGMGLLLWSPLWTARQKLLGILVWPGGYVLLFGVGVVSARACPASPGTGSSAIVSNAAVSNAAPAQCVTSAPSLWWYLAGIIFVAAPLLVAAYLYRAAGRPAETV